VATTLAAKPMHRILIAISVSCGAAMLAGASIDAQEPSALLRETAARQLERKLEMISNNAGSETGIDERMVVSEAEINAYFESEIVRSMVAGLDALNVTLREGGIVSVEAVVDFSSLEEEKRRGGFEPLSYLSGRVPVRFDGSISGRDGTGTVSVETFTVAGLPLPASVFRELVRTYTATENVPDGIDVLEAFEWPYGIVELKVEHGRIEILQ